MPLSPAPAITSAGCRTIESRLAVPVQFYAEVDVDYTVSTGGGPERTQVSGNTASDRADWEQDILLLTDNHFGLGSSECPCNDSIVIQSKDSATPSVSALPFGYTSYYLGEDDAEELLTAGGITTTENGKIRLWLLLREFTGAPRDIILLAEVTTSWGGRASTDTITVADVNWAEIVDGSPYVVSVTPPFSAPGHITWTFIAT